MRAGEVSQWEEHLPYKPDNLHPDSQGLHSSIGTPNPSILYRKMGAEHSDPPKAHGLARLVSRVVPRQARRKVGTNT